MRFYLNQHFAVFLFSSFFIFSFFLLPQIFPQRGKYGSYYSSCCSFSLDQVLVELCGG